MCLHSRGLVKNISVMAQLKMQSLMYSVTSPNLYTYMPPCGLFGCAPLGHIEDTSTINQQWVPAISVLATHLMSRNVAYVCYCQS